MAMKRLEYWSEIRNVYKDPKDYVLAGQGNAYVRIDAEAPDSCYKGSGSIIAGNLQ